MIKHRLWLRLLEASCGLLLVTVTNAPVSAEQDENPLYPSNSDQSKSASSTTTSGPIIGYKPIPESALSVVIPANAQVAASSSPATPQLRSSVAAVTSASTVQPSPSVSPLPVVYQTGVVGEGFYTLGRDDVIRIGVQNQPEFSGDFMIGFDGRIQYNYLGDIPIAGMTKYEVKQVLEQLLEQYVRVPVVNIMIVAYNSKVVYVIGEVHQPGKFIMRGDQIKLREAILAAGLPNSRAALQRVHVIQPDLEKPRVRVINVKRILYKGNLKYDIDLSAGEIVVVPSTVLSKVNDFLAARSRLTGFARM